MELLVARRRKGGAKSKSADYYELDGQKGLRRV